MNEVMINDERPTAGGSLIAVIARAATDPRVDVDKMMALLNMQQRIEAKDALDQFNVAMAEFNARCELRVAKAGTASLGGKGSYRFAKWEDMDAVIRPVMRDLGLWFSFDAKNDASGVSITGRMHHRGGHVQEALIWLPVDVGPGRNALQQVGSTISYGKRYCVEMLLNVVREDEDDDGQAGGAPRRPAPPAEPTPLTFEQKVSGALNDQPDAGKWLKLYTAACERAETIDQINYIRALAVVKKTMDKAPTTIRAIMQEALTKAVDRLAPIAPATADISEEDPVPAGGDDEIDDEILVDQILEEMAELTETAHIDAWVAGVGKVLMAGLRERSPKLWQRAVLGIDTRRMELGG